MTTRSGEPTDFGSAYRLLSGAVIPRPIAWVASRTPDGADNLAPFSFANVVAVDPPTLMIAPVGTGDDRKDTARNVAATAEFVVHVVTEPLAEAMNATSATLPAGASEFDHADVEPVECDAVDVARVAAAPVAFECELSETVEIGGSTVLFGEVVRAHVDDDLLTDGQFDTTKFHPVGRLAGGWYATTEDRFELERPP
ncbi:MAG: flavin reductase family protein [Halolamina sp.]